MSATTWVDFRVVKSAVTIEVVLERYGIFKTLRRSGTELHGCCPIHKGTNEESFRVSVKKNCFQCFAGSCGAKGNVLDLRGGHGKVLGPRRSAETSGLVFSGTE